MGLPLAEYAAKITQLKDKAGQEGNTTLRTVMKLLTNSLYGKFASKYFMSTTEIVTDNNFAEMINMYKFNSVTQINDVLKLVNYDITPDPTIIKDSRVPKDVLNQAFRKANATIIDADLNIAIAAAVTAYGRVTLYELMQEIQARGGEMCYTDTDSIYATLPEAPFGKPFGPYI
jgi:DNA polymerase elongation subunit (family B)